MSDPVLATIVLAVVCATSIQAVTTCGGLISVAPSLVRSAPSQMDFSQISLVLTTKFGLRKESVRCAPNGFYIVPIYESGSYVLEPRHPQQWTFSPARYEFTISSDRQGNDDFNFRIQGFPVHGSVSIPQTEACSDPHPIAAEVAITVQSATNSSFAPITTHPDHQGRFVIAGLAPGNYLVEAQHARRPITPDSIRHTVSWGDSNLPNFRMTGASVSGEIIAPGKIEMGLYLLPRGRPISDCPDRSESCYSAVSESGKFRFTDVPCGSYTLQIDRSAMSETFVMNVDSVDVEVGFDDVVIAPGTFAVVAVTVIGKVVHATTGLGVDQAAVFANGAEIAVTDDQGQFVWKNSDLTDKGPYDLKVFKRGHRFSPIGPFYYGDGAPVISTERYDVCGSVQIADSAAASDYSVEVIVGSSIIESLQLDDHGAFCYSAAPGSYEFRPVTSLGSLSPPTRHVTINDAPVDNVGFYQLTVAMHAFVSCFEKKSCKDVEVVLQSHKMTVSNSTSADGSVVFSELAPGSYQLSARKANLCFKPLDVNIGNHDVSNIMIKQSGISVNIESPFAVEMDLIDSVTKLSTPVSIPAGSYDLCLPSDSPSRFQLQSSPSSPYRFKHEPTTVSETMTLEMDRIHVTGKILVPTKLASTLDIEAASDQETLKATAVVISSDSDQATLEYSFWGSTGANYMISIVGSTDMVFEPNRRQVTVSTQRESFPIEIGLFRGRAGLFRTGKIIPAVPGAKAIARSSDETLTMILTNDEYRFGPLSDAADYTIEIEHPEYKFEPISTGDYRAIKLCSVQVSLVDDNTGKPIEGVLLSLSGTGYRNNTLSDVDGKVVFSGMIPGQYYLFPVLKEFVFNPPSLMIDLAEGFQTDYTITAKRTLYSIFGSLKSISKKGVSNVIVTATGLDGDHLEETMSDASGNYRIRGLSPGAKYRIALRSLDITDSIEHSVPDERIITMPAEDITGVDFVCYRRSLHGDIFGVLPNGTLPTYVELRHQKTGQLEKAVSCSPAKRFFTFSSVPFGSYVISAASKDLSIEPLQVDVSGSVKVVLKSKSIPKEEHLDNKPKTSIFTIVVGFALVFAVVNYESLQTSAKKWNERRKSKAVSVSQSWNTGSERKKKNSSTNKSRPGNIH